MTKAKKEEEAIEEVEKEELPEEEVDLGWQKGVHYFD